MIRRLAPLVALSLLAIGAAAHAQAPDPGDVGIFFTPAPTSGADARRTVAALESFSFYVLSYQVPGGVEAFEFSLDIPASAVIAGGVIFPLGSVMFWTPDNWFVGTGGICQGQSGWFTLVEYRGVTFMSAPGNDVPICLNGAHPSSFPNGEPGYLVCNAPGDIRNFGRAYAGCAIINCTNCDAVPDGALSFGAMKARY